MASKQRKPEKSHNPGTVDEAMRSVKLPLLQSVLSRVGIGVIRFLMKIAKLTARKYYRFGQGRTQTGDLDMI